GAGARWAARGGHPCSTSDREWRQSQDEPRDRGVNESKNAVSEEAAHEQDEHEHQHDGLPVAVDPEEEFRKSPPQDRRQEAVAVERRDGNQVKDRQDDIQSEPHLEHAPQRRRGGEAAGGRPQLERYSYEKRDHELGHGALQGHQRSLAGATEAQRSHPYWL